MTIIPIRLLCQMQANYIWSRILSNHMQVQKEKENFVVAPSFPS